MTLDQIREERLKIAAELEPLQRRVRELQSIEDDLRSRNFIEVNKVTRDQLQLSKGDGVPWFGYFKAFGDWLAATNSTKRFCEWNGRIYFTSEVIAGRMEYDAPGRADDVPA